MDLALNNPQRLVCHKPKQANKQISCNKTLFLLSTKVLTVPFHSVSTLPDFILFKDTTLKIPGYYYFLWNIIQSKQISLGIIYY